MLFKDNKDKAFYKFPQESYLYLFEFNSINEKEIDFLSISNHFIFQFIF